MRRSTLLAAAASLALAGQALAAPAASDLSRAEAQASRALAQADRLDDQRAVERLQMIYGFYFDKKLWSEVAALFAPDGTMELDNRGLFVGPASIRRSLDVFGPQPIRTGQLQNYMQLQPVVTVAPDGRTAKGRWHAFVQTGVTSQGGEWADGVYENDYVKLRGGTWAIKRLRYCQTMRTDYAQGWAKSALPAPGLDPRYPPDRPPTGGCSPYPQISGPSLHFLKPVSN
jgi:hypothetical protein